MPPQSRSIDQPIAFVGESIYKGLEMVSLHFDKWYHHAAQLLRIGRSSAIVVKA